MKESLSEKLTNEELKVILDKQTELLKLEQHLASVQPNQEQEAKVIYKEPLVIPSSSKNN